jgi:hypothetical protein
VRWSDRVFFRDSKTGVVDKLSSIWSDSKQPLVIRAFARASRLLESRSLHAAIRQFSSSTQELA